MPEDVRGAAAHELTFTRSGTSPGPPATDRGWRVRRQLHRWCVAAGGEWCGRRGARPGDRRGARQGAVERQGRRRRRGRRGRHGVRDLGPGHAARAGRAPAGAGRRGRGQPRRAEAPRDGQRRQAGVDHRLRVRPHGRQPPLLRRSRSLPRHAGRGRVPRGPHLDAAPRPARRVRRHRAVELPAQHGRVEAGPGTGRRQHLHPQALRAHAPHGAEAGRDRRRHLPARRVQRAVRPGRDRRRRAGAPPRRGDALADGRREHRQAHRAQRRRHAQAGAPRAGRQGAGAGVRRRRHRRRGRHPRRDRLLQLRPGLHGAVPRHRRAGDLRRPRGQPRRPPSRRSPRATRTTPTPRSGP